MGFLTDEEIAELRPAPEAMFPSPIPTRVVSSDEFAPIPQTERQREVEARIKSMADEIGGKQNRSRRSFLATASGMAAAFLAMNEVYGPVLASSPPRRRSRSAPRPARPRSATSSSWTSTPISSATTPATWASWRCAARSAAPAGTRR